MEPEHGLLATLLGDLLSDLQRVLGDDLVAAYLYGSAVSGGFDPRVSDIDMVVVTSRDVVALDLPGLERMHDAFVGRHPAWKDRIEVAYIGKGTLASFRTSTGSLAVISPGEPLHIRGDRVAQWLQNWYLVRETAVCLYGLDPRVVIPLIAWEEFAAAIVRYAEHIRCGNRVGATGGTIAYAVLTMCRALRVIRTRAHSSKEEAAAWTREQVPEWAWLIDAALECRRSGGRLGFGTEHSRDSAETFIRFVVADISGHPTA